MRVSSFMKSTISLGIVWMFVYLSYLESSVQAQVDPSSQTFFGSVDEATENFGEKIHLKNAFDNLHSKKADTATTTADNVDEEQNPSILEKLKRREFFNLREDKLARKIVSRVRRREEDDLLIDLIEQDDLDQIFSSPSILRKTIKANPMLLSFKVLRDIHEEQDPSLITPERGLKALKNMRFAFKKGMGLLKQLKSKEGQAAMFKAYDIPEDETSRANFPDTKRQIAELIATMDESDVEGQDLLRKLIIDDHIGEFIDADYFFGSNGDLPEYAKFNKEIIFQDPFLKRTFNEAEPMFEEFLNQPGDMIQKMGDQVFSIEKD